MLRRAPSWISLQEEELQWHLDRAFLQSLPDLSRLHLDDRDEYDDPVTDPSDDNNTSGESGQEHHSSSFHSLARASSSIKHSSVKTRASADANPTPNRVSNNAPASTSQVSSLLHHQACQPPERPFCDITPITLSRKIQDREIRHCRDQENRGNDPMLGKPTSSHSRQSTVQAFRLSSMAMPTMTTSSVPPQPPVSAYTKPNESILTRKTVSPAPMVDPVWKPGAIEPESVFEDARTDRGGRQSP